MLVLSRKVGERIVVPDLGVELTVVAITGNTVRLGVSAPADINVYREELRGCLGRQARGAAPKG